MPELTGMTGTKSASMSSIIRRNVSTSARVNPTSNTACGLDWQNARTPGCKLY